MPEQGNVGAVCVRQVVVAEGNESVLELARLMRQHHVGDVVIVDRRGDKSYPSGIVTDRDIVVDALVTSPENLGELTARDLVKRELVSVREDQNIDDALEIMRVHGVRRAPVVDDKGGRRPRGAVRRSPVPALDAIHSPAANRARRATVNTPRLNRRLRLSPRCAERRTRNMARARPPGGA
jgi:CBS domain-containing protein